MTGFDDHCHKLAKTATESILRRSERPYIEELTKEKSKYGAIGAERVV
jgi:hypothetical protein